MSKIHRGLSTLAYINMLFSKLYIIMVPQGQEDRKELSLLYQV